MYKSLLDTYLLESECLGFIKNLKNDCRRNYTIKYH